MYLQRYSHIQRIHPYLNRHVLMELYIPRQCTNPPETQLTVPGLNQSQLLPYYYNLLHEAGLHKHHLLKQKLSYQCQLL